MFAVSESAQPNLAAHRPAPLASAVPGCQMLEVVAAKALCEANVLRLLTRTGLAVQRRCWGPANVPGGAPVLWLWLHPTPQDLLAQAAGMLHQHTGAKVQLHAGQHTI